MTKEIHFDKTDRAISKSNEDLLDLNEYINGICALINQTFQEKKSACIGIVGKWGDGKTSAINLCINKLKKEYKIIKNVNFTAVIIFLIAAWLFSLLLKSNLTVIIEKLIFIYTITINFLGSRLNLILVSSLILLCLYKQVINLFYNFFKALRKLFSFWFLKNQYIEIRFSPWDCSDKNQIFKEYLKSLAKDLFLFSPTVSSLLLTYSKEITGVNLAPLAKAVNPYSNIATLKQEITNILEHSNKRIIVVIDDFDRIHCNEIFNMLKLIGSIANFPNIVNIVAYDKDYISEELKECFKDKKTSKDKINRYLQKIIQDELPLPKISHEKIFNIFMPKLDEIISDFDYNKEELISNYKNTLGGYLINIRNVKKLLNAFEFHYKIFRARKININIIDLLFITALKTFNFELWQKIYNIGKDLFMSDIGSSSYFTEQVREENRSDFYEKKLNFNTLNPQELNILGTLIPSILENDIRHIYCIDDKEQFDLKRLMSSQETFNLYFEFNPPESNLKEIIKQMTSSSFNRISIEHILRTDIDFSDLRDFLKSKQYRDKIDKNVILNFIELILLSTKVYESFEENNFVMRFLSNDNVYMQSTDSKAIENKFYSLISQSEKDINFNALVDSIFSWLLYDTESNSREKLRTLTDDEKVIQEKILPILKEKFENSDIFNLSLNTIYTFYYSFNQINSEYKTILQDKILNYCKAKDNEELLDLFVHLMTINWNDKRSLNILDGDVFIKEAKDIIREKLTIMSGNKDIMNKSQYMFTYYDSNYITSGEMWSNKPYHIVNFILKWCLNENKEEISYE